MASRGHGGELRSSIAASCPRRYRELAYAFLFLEKGSHVIGSLRFVMCLKLNSNETMASMSLAESDPPALE